MPMRNRRWSLGALAIGIVMVLAIAWSQLGPGEVPEGQPPLVTLDLTSLDTLRSDFNRNSDHARVIMLLSPT